MGAVAHNPPAFERPLPPWRTVVPVLVAVVMLAGLTAGTVWALRSVLALGAWFLAQ